MSRPLAHLLLVAAVGSSAPRLDTVAKHTAPSKNSSLVTPPWGYAFPTKASTCACRTVQFQ
jgi:hypothetical protein